MKPKLQYFGVPGRGEAVRLMLKLRGDSYSDVYINTKAWRSEIKKKTKWNVIPVITLENGQNAGMSRAILRYLGKTTFVEGETLYPTDPNEALIVDEGKYKFPSLFYF
eukprot:g7481.t1